MRRLFFAGIIAVSLLASHQASARSDISIDFFYNTLSPYGSWVDVADYGYCWQPSVAISNANWRPYSDGYWAYTDVGWTWVSYEDFGWATYHYGRWARLRDRGWFWIPGYEWGPAWVSWRTGGDYVGWAPLPPRPGAEVVYEGRPVRGDVDIAFDIGPLYYNFIDVRYIGEPLLRERIFDPMQNVTYIERTVNVTNITYNNSQVYNYGPDYNTLSAYSTRPIQRLALQRETNIDPAAVANQPSALTQVKGDKLVVAAPLRVEKPPQPVAPKVVKEKIATPTVERGWSAIGDERKIAQLKEKIKAEDPKKVPPPDIPPKPGAPVAASAATSPAALAPPPPAAAPNASSAPAAPAATAPVPPANAAKGKGKNQRNAPAVTNASPAPSAAPGGGAPPATAPAQSPVVQQQGKGKRNRPETMPAPPNAAAAQPPPNASTPPNLPQTGKGKNKRAEQQPVPPRPTSAAPPVSAPPPNPAAERRQKAAKTPLPPNAQAPPLRPENAPVPPEARGKRQREIAPPPAAAFPPAQPRPQRVAPPMQPPAPPRQMGNPPPAQAQPGKGEKPKKPVKPGEEPPPQQ